MCVCVRERESACVLECRERESMCVGERERRREKDSEGHELSYICVSWFNSSSRNSSIPVSTCKSLCVCVSERVCV